ncbi:MAG: hypothetical protein U9N35_05360 [Euryarchaeota archaeon]|nr:hypothetical protein [Euryarchaeota archaeon]
MKGTEKLRKHKKLVAVLGVLVIAASVYVVQSSTEHEFRAEATHIIVHPEYGTIDNLTEEENEALNDIEREYTEKVNSLVLKYAPDDAELTVKVCFKSGSRDSEKLEAVENYGEVLKFSGGGSALIKAKAENISKIRKADTVYKIDLFQIGLLCRQKNNLKYIPSEVISKAAEEYQKEKNLCIEEIIEAHRGEKE